MINVSRRMVLAGVAFMTIGASFIAYRAISGNKTSDDPTGVSNQYNTVNDTSAGISFNMSKDLRPIPKDELAALNPGFNYGFRHKDDAKASCILSQSALTGSGSVTSQELQEGLFDEVKKIHPDAKLLNKDTAANPIKFGDAQGVLLELSFVEEKEKTKRVEIIAIGKAAQAIAYCQSPLADSQKYYNAFTIFFSSLKINNPA